MNTWFNANTKSPEIGKVFEFKGPENGKKGQDTILMSFICILDKYSKMKILHIKQHTTASRLAPSDYENIFTELIPEDKWRYIDNNELMAYL